MFDFDGTLADSGETAVLATQATFKVLYQVVIRSEVTWEYRSKNHFH